ncbi:hypothetical protein QBZ16_001516 [Prototheca wickerhamii]|uniref:Major facilitator superfamily (MFS) profile domain-containing protein n=1 Tax=Prototheca wickerhamii TaxID=3111 RepID=A0AAD9IEV8_PROWI|nr:hypothetical protein QBZ16_001516 [Prototheca wickerhamii]
MALDVTASIDAIGFGKFQWLLLVYTGLAWVADACETMLLSFLGPAIECDWGASPARASALTSVVFAGMMAGVYSLGAISDHWGRRRGFLVSALLLGGAGLGSAFSRTYLELFALRATVGFALGGAPIGVTLFAEFVPGAGRGMWLLVMQSFWTVGTVLMSTIAWGTVASPGLGWRWMLALGSAPLFVLLAAFPWVPESPHWLAAHGREAEAREVLRLVARVNGARPAPVEAGDESPAGCSDGEGGAAAPLPPARAPLARRVRLALAALYGPDMRRTTLLLDGIWFINAITYYGLVLLCTELQTVRKKERCTAAGQPNLGSRDFRAILLTTFSEAPGMLMAAALVDGRGRKWSLRAGMALTGGAILLLLLAGPGSSLELGLLFVSRAGIMGAYSILYIYTPEIRAFGLAMCSAMSRLGGFLAPYATVALVESGRQAWTLSLLGGLCLGACVAAFFLRTETRGRDLQETRVDSEAEDAPLHPASPTVSLISLPSGTPSLA